MRTPIALAFTALLTGLAIAQDAKETPETDHLPIHFEVLHSKRVSLGDHLMILNRVVPPVLPPAPPRPPEPTAEDVANAEAAEAQAPQKRSEMLLLSASVLDPHVIGVQWFSEEREYRFLTNFDFNSLFGLGTFETADAVWSLMPGVPNESEEEVGDFNNLTPGPDAQRAASGQNPPSARPRIAYVSDPEESELQPPAGILAALDALRTFYNANRDRLAEDFAKREAARIEREQWLKENPPKPKDTIINYWIGPAPVLPAGNTTGGRP